MNATFQTAALACERECPTRWCCSIEKFSLPPLSPREIRRLETALGKNDFHMPTRHGRVMKHGSDGYCVFFNKPEKNCGVYRVRPFDCRIFPFDFYVVSDTQAQWILYDCPFSRRIPEEKIEPLLTEMERRFRIGFLETWHYQNDADENDPSEYRLLRPMRLFPQKSPLGIWR